MNDFRWLAGSSLLSEVKTPLTILAIIFLTIVIVTFFLVRYERSKIRKNSMEGRPCDDN